MRSLSLGLLRDDSLALPPVELDAMLLHELCHWYIDSGLQREAPMLFTDDVKNSGCDLFDRTDKEKLHITRHSLEFCTLICAASIGAAQAALIRQAANDFAVAAMKFDIDFGNGESEIAV